MTTSKLSKTEQKLLKILANRGCYSYAGVREEAAAIKLEEKGLIKRLDSNGWSYVRDFKGDYIKRFFVCGHIEPVQLAA